MKRTSEILLVALLFTFPIRFSFAEDPNRALLSSESAGVRTSGFGYGSSPQKLGETSLRSGAELSASSAGTNLSFLCDFVEDRDICVAYDAQCRNDGDPFTDVDDVYLNVTFLNDSGSDVTHWFHVYWYDPSGTRVFDWESEGETLLDSYWSCWWFNLNGFERCPGDWRVELEVREYANGSLGSWQTIVNKTYEMRFSGSCTSDAQCDDGNPCTDNWCDCTCQSSNNSATCNDGVFCNGTDSCSGGSCSSHSGNPCASGPVCADSCNEGARNCFDSSGTQCTSDFNVCTDDLCDGSGNCTHIPNNAPCDDGDFCNGTEMCGGGVCQSSGDPCGPCETCQGTSCVSDCGPCESCLAGACVSDCSSCEECNAGTCQSSVVCGDAYCDTDCDEVCPADCDGPPIGFRSLPPTYCSEEPIGPAAESICVKFTPPAGALAVGVEDCPPAGWFVSNISDAGVWDPTNGKVKWGPFFAPFPPQVCYDATPPLDAQGQQCMACGVVSVDGINHPTSGDSCMDGSTCPSSICADQPQATCPGCGDCSCGTCDDSRVELCEMIGYACQWKAGCNDDLGCMTRSAFLWKSSEYYCWDETAQNWFPRGPSDPVLCPSGSKIDIAAILGEKANGGSATALIKHRKGRGTRSGRRTIPITINAPEYSFVTALELYVPQSLSIVSISDEGVWDEVNRKVKWGPYFDQPPQSVSVVVRQIGRAASLGEILGTVSFDGSSQPIEIIIKK